MLSHRRESPSSLRLQQKFKRSVLSFGTYVRAKQVILQEEEMSLEKVTDVEKLNTCG